MVTATTSRLHRFLQYLEVEDGPQRQVDRAYRRLGKETLTGPAVTLWRQWWPGWATPDAG